MTPAVQPTDWSTLDDWWTAYSQPQSVARRSASAPVPGQQLADCWADVDPWWERYSSSVPHTQSATTERVLGTQLTDCWADLDPWWDAYSETGHDIAVALASLLEESNATWTQSNAPFDSDPLAANLTTTDIQRGPLRPSGEVAWSRWLARVLGPSAPLIADLFDVPVEMPPREVTREDQLSKQDGSFRRPDILLVHENRGISIEVKLGDENYPKTAETARLVERHYDDLAWTHVLLLPKQQRGRLEAIVGPQLHEEPDGRLTIAWDDPGPVGVVYWRDVTAAIRSVLRRGAAVDDHWAANAYLFCAVAEQHLVGFQPQGVVERLAEPANVVDTIQPIRLADVLDEQLSYLQREVGP